MFQLLLVLHPYSHTRTQSLGIYCVPFSLRLPIAHISCTSMEQKSECIRLFMSLFLSIPIRSTVEKKWEEKHIFLSHFFPLFFHFLSSFHLQSLSAFFFHSHSHSFSFSVSFSRLFVDRPIFLRLNSPNTMIDHGFGVLCVFQVTSNLIHRLKKDSFVTFFFSMCVNSSTQCCQNQPIYPIEWWAIFNWWTAACCFIFWYNERN